MRFLALTLSASLLSVSLDIHAEVTSLPCDEKIFNGLLFSTVPTYSGVADYLEKLLTQPEVHKACLEKISKSQLGAEAIGLGKSYREAYLSLLQSHFEGDDRFLVLKPYVEILFRLRKTIAQDESGRRRESERLPPEWMIQQRALEDTRQRFKLDPNLNLERIQHLASASDDFVYEQALRNYRRVEMQLRLVMRVKDKAPPPPSPERFKSETIEKLNELRALNFKAAAREGLVDWKNHSVILRDIINGLNHEIRLEELIQMDVRFLSADVAAKSDVRLERTLPKVLRHWVVEKFIRKRDNLMNYYSANSAKENRENNQMVQLRDREGASYVISHSDYLGLLHTMGPRIEGDHFGAEPVLHRFRLESTAREVQLSNAILFLSGVKDRTYSDFEQRLLEKTEHPFSLRQATEFLTYEINASSAYALRDTVQNDILWSGWAKHPEHWRLRAQEARDLSNDTYETPQNEKKTISGIFAQALNLEKIKKRQKSIKTRFLPEEKRAKIARRSLTGSVALFVSGALALVAGSSLSIDSVREFVQEQIPSYLKGSDSDSSIWDFSGRFTAGRGDESLDSSVDAQNLEIPPDQAGKGEGKSKTIDDPHNPRSSPYSIEVIYKRRNDLPQPQYFNFTNKVHIAEWIDPNRSYDNVGPIETLTNVAWDAEPDLVIDVNNRTHASAEGRIPLAQIRYYRLSGVSLYDWKNKLIPQYDYDLYHSMENQQVYARLKSKKFSGPFTSRLYYRYAPKEYEEGRLAKGLPKSVVARINERLEKAGFTDVSQSLKKLMAENPRQKGLDFNWMSMSFKSSSTYIFKYTSWPINKTVEPAFRPFTKFLVKGRLYYQCTGSNRFYQTVINEAVAASPPDNYPIKAIPLVGYAADDSRGVTRKAIGHLHSLIIGGNWREQTPNYLETDATPLGSRDTPPPEVPLPPRPIPEELLTLPPVILPQAPKVVNGPHENHPTSDAGHNPETNIRVSPVRTFEEIERILARLETMSDLSWKEVESATLTDHWLRNYPQPVQLPGLRQIILAHRLVKSFRAHHTPAQLVAHLQGRPSNELEPKEAIEFANRFFIDELASYRKFINSLTEPAPSGPSDQFQFLLYDPLRTHLKHIVETLSLYEWGFLLEDYSASAAQSAGAKARCEGALE